jgi:FlaA1/EpsC-like NDP-sugar epimerase
MSLVSAALTEKCVESSSPPASPAIPGLLLRSRRLVVVGLHALLIPIAYFLAYWLRFDGAVPDVYQTLFWQTVALLLGVRLACFGGFGLFQGWWRHVGMYDLVDLVKAVTLSSVFLLAALFFGGLLDGFPRSILVLDWLLAVLFFGGIRFGVRWYREGAQVRPWRQIGKRTLVVGAGSAGAQLIRLLRQDSAGEIHLVGLVDDDPLKRGFRIHGVPVLGSTLELQRLVEQHDIQLLVVAIPSASREQMKQLVERCHGLAVEVKVVPSVMELVDGRARLGQLRAVRVQDLLGRDPISLDLELVDADLAGRVVLITGGAGSIGSELARQVAALGPARLIVVDQAESPLYFVHLELQKSYPGLTVVPIIADVTDAERIRQIFAECRPECVFHAAAYKHVPLMEANVGEAVRNNVLGTFSVADAAISAGVRKFVLISTDKAVNPSSVMGATKRIAERLVLGWPQFQSSGTDFRAVRFGNVLGSDGSVIPLFRKQIAAGGPVTVTHPEITRYFMTIPEAVQLVLQASSLPEAAGRISMLEMGEPVKIVELAENLIRLSGLEPYREMPIVFTGLRPGEKLFEELMTEVETTVPTALEKVRVVQSDEAEPEAIEWGMAQLCSALETQDPQELVRGIRELVPEWVSPLRDSADLLPGDAVPVPGLVGI